MVAVYCNTIQVHVELMMQWFLVMCNLFGICLPRNYGQTLKFLYYVCIWSVKSWLFRGEHANIEDAIVFGGANHVGIWCYMFLTGSATSVCRSELYMVPTVPTLSCNILQRCRHRVAPQGSDLWSPEETWHRRMSRLCGMRWSHEQSTPSGFQKSCAEFDSAALGQSHMHSPWSTVIICNK